MAELSLIVKVTLVLVLALLATRLASGTPASVRSLLLASAFGLLIVLPLASLALPARTIEVPAGQTVLSLAKKQGIRIPSSCANGLCGTCKSKLVSGNVDMTHNGGIRQREIDTGWFLPCCSKPLSDLVIDR